MRAQDRDPDIRRARYSLIPALLCLPLGVLAAAGAYYAISGPASYDVFLFYHRAYARAFSAEGVGGLVSFLSALLGVCAAGFALGSLLGLVRRPWTLGLIRRCYVGVYALAVVYACAVVHVTGIIAARGLRVGGAALGPVDLFEIRCVYLWPAGLVTAAFFLLHTVSLRRATLDLYAPPAPPAPALGDRILENIRTHGGDPQYRKSLLASATTHLMVIVVLPWLLLLRGCIEPYLVPWGSGRPAVAHVQIVQRKVKKREKKFILRPDSKIIWQAPDLDESDIRKQVDADTQLTHVADVAAVHGKMGAGGGTRGGWPEGVPGGKLRFIRIKHGGRDWDDGMDNTTRADVNFLHFIRKEVPFRVARKGEAHEVRLLPRYPPGRAPPFMYLTGEGYIRGISSSDVKIMRGYCLAGGMLFADAGSARFDRDFRRLIRQVFPDKRLVIIADDDPIFQMPYVFPHGCPPLWHHGGRKAWGVKHRGRWCVFYHPGDLNDAWKTGHSGLRPRLAKGAYQMGVNVIYYAITHYLEMTKKLRK